MYTRRASAWLAPASLTGALLDAGDARAGTATMIRGLAKVSPFVYALDEVTEHPLGDVEISDHTTVEQDEPRRC